MDKQTDIYFSYSVSCIQAPGQDASILMDLFPVFKS